MTSIANNFSDIWYILFVICNLFFFLQHYEWSNGPQKANLLVKPDYKLGPRSFKWKLLIGAYLKIYLPTSSMLLQLCTHRACELAS